MVKNPFKGELYYKIGDGEITAYFDLEPIYPNPYPIIIITWIIVLIISKVQINGFYIIPIIMTLSLIARTEVFYRGMIEKALIKKGYLGTIKRIRWEDCK